MLGGVEHPAVGGRQAGPQTGLLVGEALAPGRIDLLLGAELLEGILNRKRDDERKRNYTRHATREYNIHKNLDHHRVVQLFDVFAIDLNVGITTNLENLGLEEMGVATDKGRVTTDDYYQTNVPGIYAIGDVIATPWLAHLASKEGIMVVEKIAGKKVEPIKQNLVPNCTYCHPEVASVGLTEAAAKAKGHEVKVVKCFVQMTRSLPTFILQSPPAARASPAPCVSAEQVVEISLKTPFCTKPASLPACPGRTRRTAWAARWCATRTAPPGPFVEVGAIAQSVRAHP